MAEATKEAGKKPIDRVIRVFVSSTFADMHAEREELVKRVFPELRKLCEARGVTWGEVDLRWGIPDERQGEVLPICLEEIHRCRPYFIGILGERYGWVPREMSEDLIQAQSWLKEHVQEGKSVTELEILHGVLNDPQMATHAFFYFRDPVQAAGLVEGPDQDEVKELGPVEAAAWAEGRKLKLAALKDRIRQAHRDGKIAHPPRENFAGPTALGELVKQDLRGVIDALFPEGSQPDPLTREAAEHESSARSRARVYVERPALFAALDAHAAGDGPPLVVLGESGGGKSALMANWARCLRERSDAPFVIEHYIGATPASTDWAAMCRRVLDEVSRRFDLKLEIPDKPEALRAAFANGLYRAAAQGRMVLVLDGLNQLEDRDQAPDLVWLPPEVPPNVRLVLSTLPGRSLEALRERGWPTMAVDLLSVEERRKLIPKYLKQYGKELSPARTERLAMAPETANPLYLRTLLEELRQWGDNETLDDRINHYLAATTPRELFTKVLARWEQDFERDRPHLVRDAMVHLWAARRGLSETELLEMLGRDNEPLLRAHWSPLHLAADASLVSRSGLLGFAHDYLRQAVEERCLSTAEARRTAHTLLAEYFCVQPLGPRKLDELPWQLLQTRDWKRLFELLGDPSFICAAWEANEVEVRALWTEVEQNSPLRAVEAYSAFLGSPLMDPNGWDTVVSLFYKLGCNAQALAALRRLVEYRRGLGDRAELASSISLLATILWDEGALDETSALWREAEDIYRSLGDNLGLACTLGGQALVLVKKGDSAGALTLFGKQERLLREMGRLDALPMVLRNQAAELSALGNWAAASAKLEESETLCRQCGDREGMGSTFHEKAVLANVAGNPEEAMALSLRAEAMHREMGSKGSLWKMLTLQADIFERWERVDEALAKLGEAEQLHRDLDDPLGVASCQIAQARLLASTGELTKALGLHQGASNIARKHGDKGLLRVSLAAQGEILKSQGDLRSALRALEEHGRVCIESGRLEDAAASLDNQAVITSDLGDPGRALKLHRFEEKLWRDTGKPEQLISCLANQALVLWQELGLPAEALPVAQEAHRMAETHGLADLAGRMMEIVERLGEEVNGGDTEASPVVGYYGCPKGCALGKQRHFGVPGQTPICWECGTRLKLVKRERW